MEDPSNVASQTYFKLHMVPTERGDEKRCEGWVESPKYNKSSQFRILHLQAISLVLLTLHTLTMNCVYLMILLTVLFQSLTEMWICIRFWLLQMMCFLRDPLNIFQKTTDCFTVKL